MECSNLKIFVELIKLYSPYHSNAEISKRLGISEGTLRGYWDMDKVQLASIPEKNVDKFCELLIEIVPRDLSKDSARHLLQSDPLLFHTALCPISGRAWHALITQYIKSSKLEVIVKPMPTLQFGEPDDEPDKQSVATLKLNQRFYFQGCIGWRGECVVFAEHMHEWHLCSVAKEQRIVSLNTNTFTIPDQSKQKPISFQERNKVGLYRYFVVACKNKFSDNLRQHLFTANPISQQTLDMLGDLFRAYGKDNCQVLGATILVEQ